MAAPVCDLQAHAGSVSKGDRFDEVGIFLYQQEIDQKPYVAYGALHARAGLGRSYCSGKL